MLKVETLFDGSTVSSCVRDFDLSVATNLSRLVIRDVFTVLGYFMTFMSMVLIALQSSTRKLSYRKDDRAMRPMYGRPDNFQESLR